MRVLLFVLLLGTFSLSAQDTFYFQKGLVVNAPVRYGREALYMDELAWQLYQGNLKTPVEQATFMKDDKGEAVTWKTGRGVILFGNASTNSVYKTLLNDCPIYIERGKISAGNKTWQGDDLATYFVWPIKGSANASVAVIAGSGIKGMQAANANQYFAGASGFPDFMIYSMDMLHEGTKHLKSAGFFDNNWRIAEAEQYSEQ